MLLFAVLYGFWAANFIAFNGDALRELATQFLALAEKHSSLAPIMVGHRLMGHSLFSTGDILDGRAHLISRLRSMILSNTVPWRPVSARTFGWLLCRTAVAPC
jgi:hypothetical protein